MGESGLFAGHVTTDIPWKQVRISDHALLNNMVGSAKFAALINIIALSTFITETLPLKAQVIVLYGAGRGNVFFLN
jgi:hypothetical protein